MSSQRFLPSLERPCPESTARETLASAAAPAARAQISRRCIPCHRWEPCRSLLQVPLDFAALRGSADAPSRRAAKSGMRGPRPPSAHQSALPPPRASPSVPELATADAARSGRCSVQGSEMHSWPSRRRTKAAGNLKLFRDHVLAAPTGLQPPCVVGLSASNQEWL